MSWLIEEINRRLKIGEPFEISTGVLPFGGNFTKLAERRRFKFVGARTLYDSELKRWFPEHHCFNPMENR